MSLERQGQLAGKVAIVTGGARGIGGAIARLFVEEGARVVIADLLDEPGEALAAELGPNARYQRTDVTDDAAWERLVQVTEQNFGHADILVNNAGIAVFARIEDTTLEQWNRVFAVNSTGTFLGIKALAPRMAETGGGSIVNVSSNEAMRGTNGLGAYAASKWASRGLTKVAAMEYGHRGVRVNSVHPGGTNTDIANPTGRSAEDLQPTYRIQPIQRIGRPREVAAVCLFLASDASTYMCGSEVAVDGGSSLGRYREGLPGRPA